MERTYHHEIKTLLHIGSLAAYYISLAMVAMNTLEQRRILQSLIIFFRFPQVFQIIFLKFLNLD